LDKKADKSSLNHLKLDLVVLLERGDKDVKNRYDVLLRDCNKDLTTLREEFEEHV